MNRIAILSESSADEQAIGILAEAVLGKKIRRVDGPPLRSRGWPAVKKSLAAVIKHLHYRTDAVGLIVVVDSDHTPIDGESSRMSEMRYVVEKAISSLTAVEGRRTLQVAIGLAAPAIESWLLAGEDAQATEAAWRVFHQDRSASSQVLPRKNALKQALYGTDRPSLQLETERMSAAAQRLYGQTDVLRTHFPVGFGQLADELDRWRDASQLDIS